MTDQISSKEGELRVFAVTLTAEQIVALREHLDQTAGALPLLKTPEQLALRQATFAVQDAYEAARVTTLYPPWPTPRADALAGRIYVQHGQAQKTGEPYGDAIALARQLERELTAANRPLSKGKSRDATSALPRSLPHVVLEWHRERVSHLLVVEKARRWRAVEPAARNAESDERDFQGGAVRRNRYTCQKCGGQIVTEDRDEGTTPFMIDCKVKVGCKGPMQSSFYRGVGPDEPTTFIWRKPTASEIARANKPMLQHFAMGGLDIYPCETHAQGQTTNEGEKR